MKVLYTVYTRNGNQFTSKGRFTTPAQAETLAEIVRKSGACASVGEFYIFSRDEWSRDQYRDRLPDAAGTVRDCTVIAGKHGSTLIYRGLHFEIV